MARTIFTLLSLLALLWPGPAHSRDAKEEAKGLYRTGKALFQEGQYKEALTRLKAAYTLDPNALLLYNMALCYEKLGRAQEAIDAYRAFLDEKPDSEDRPTIEGWIERLEETIRVVMKVTTTPPGATLFMKGERQCVTPCEVQVLPGLHGLRAELKGYRTHTWWFKAVSGEGQDLTATLEVRKETSLALTLSRPGARVLVDGELMATAPLDRPLPLSPGSHQVAVLAEGFLPWRSTIDLEEGEEISREVVLLREGATRGLRIAAWSTAGLSAAAAAVAAVLGGLHLSAVGELEDMVGQEVWTREDDDLLQRSRSYQIGGWVLAGTALAAATTSTVLFILGYRDSPLPAQEAGPGPGTQP